MMMFLAKLQAGSSKRVPLELVQRHFYELFPEVQSSHDRGARLLDALRKLEVSGHIALPAKGSWERLGSPPLPKWISICPAQDARLVRRDFNAVPWAPELGFWPELNPAQLSTLERINEFLLRRRGAFRQVPIKERSLEIFGDEKKLDRMWAGDALFSGRLSLNTLGCFRVPLPLPYRQADAPGRPVLVLENHNSFWSFGEWNHDAKRYAAVVFGSGEAFRSTGAALGQVLREVQGDGALYLGDLDPKGVRIPCDFNRTSAPNEPKVEPALDLYRWLLRIGRKREKPECASGDPQAAQAWLGESIGKEVAALWAAGRWIPQEALGCEQLMADGVDASAPAHEGHE